VISCVTERAAHVEIQGIGVEVVLMFGAVGVATGAWLFVSGLRRVITLAQLASSLGIDPGEARQLAHHARLKVVRVPGDPQLHLAEDEVHRAAELVREGNEHREPKVEPGNNG
jgi:hypothetical protein